MKQLFKIKLFSIFHLVILSGVVGLFLIICGNTAQSQPIFTASDIDVSAYPRLKTTFFVTDAFGIPFKDLNDSNFNVIDNGKSVNATLNVDCKKIEIDPSASIVLVLDQSYSMFDKNEVGATRWDWVVLGATSFVNTINFELAPQTQIAVVSFASISLLRCPFTKNKQALIDSIKKTDLGGGTKYDPPFFGPNASAIEMLKSMPPNIRRIIIFLTDGQPNIIPMTDGIVNSLLSANIQVYSITVGMEMNDYLYDISSRTGGKTFAIYTVDDLKSIYKYIALDIQTKQTCDLSWSVPWVCKDQSTTRNVDIQFLPTLLTINKTYTSPLNRVPRVQTSADIISFGNTAPNASKDTIITLTPQIAPFQVNQMSIVPSSHFSIIDYNVGGPIQPPPFTIDTGRSRKIRIQFTQDSIVGYRQASLIIDGTPCPPQITLFGGFSQIIIVSPNGGEFYSTCDTITIQWAGVEPTSQVVLSYSSDSGNSWNLITSNATGLSYRWATSLSGVNIKIRAEIAQKSSYQWAQSGGGTGNDAGVSIAVSPDNFYVYVAGSFESKAIFGKDTLKSIGNKDIFLVKYDLDGNVIWATSAGGPGLDTASGVAVDNLGNIYVTGTCYQRAVFGSTNPVLEYGSTPYCFLAKYPPSGNTPMVKIIGPYNIYNNFAAWGQKIKISGNNVYITGGFNGTVYINGFKLPSWYTTDTHFFADYDLSLSLLELNSYTSDTAGYSSKFAFDSHGNSYQTGSFTKTLNSGGYTLTSAGNSDMFVRKYGSTPGSFDKSDTTFTIESPVLSLSTLFIQMKDCSLGSSQDQTFHNILCNNGNLPVIISSVTFIGANPGDFSLESSLDSRVIQPGECISVEILFTPTDFGVRSCQLLIDGVCINTLKLVLAGNCVCSGLTAGSQDFGKIVLNKQKNITINCAFQNTNSEPITINPIISGINPNDFQLDTSGAIVLLPDSCFSPVITFAPTASGDRSAYIDYQLPEGCDNYKTDLTGIGTEVDVSISSIDWGARRVLTDNDSLIIIKNNSLISPAIITGINFINLPENEFELISPQPNLPDTIATAGQLQIPIRFIPHSELHYSDTLVVSIWNLDIPLKTSVQGDGILPKIALSWECGEPVFPGSTSSGRLIVTNPSTTADLIIDSIVFTNANGEFDWKNGIPKNITILKNNNTSFDVTFIPISSGIRANQIKITSDAVTGPGLNPRKDTLLDISCEALGLVYSNIIDFSAWILCETAQKTIHINNTSSNTTLIITGYNFTGSDSIAFSLSSVFPISIKPNDSVDFPITFSASEARTYHCNLNLLNSLDAVININLTGSGEFLHLYNVDDVIKVTPGNSYTVAVNGKIGQLAKGFFSNLSLILKYDPNMLSDKPNTFISSLPKTDWSWNPIEHTKMGELHISGFGNLNTAFDLELFKIDFDVFLTSSLETNIYLQDSLDPCVTPLETGTIFRLSNICYLTGRLIKVNSTKFALEGPLPNPASSDMSLNFSIPYECQTRIELYDILGNSVYSLVNCDLGSGEYSAEIPVSSMPNGSYLIKMQAGPFTETKILNVNK